MLRRALATVVALLTLNVSAAEALRVCASQATHEHGAASSAPAEPRHHQHHDAPAPVDQSHDNCETPPESPAACCDALSSCGTTLSIDGATDEDGVAPDRGSLNAAAKSPPRSLNGSPEPPPPKGQA